MADTIVTIPLSQASSSLNQKTSHCSCRPSAQATKLTPGLSGCWLWSCHRAGNIVRWGHDVGHGDYEEKRQCFKLRGVYRCASFLRVKLEQRLTMGDLT